MVKMSGQNLNVRIRSDYSVPLFLLHHCQGNWACLNKIMVGYLGNKGCIENPMRGLQNEE